MLESRNLTVKIPNSSEKILKGISATFPASSLNALVGPSGCGKTTLIKAFLGMIESEGEIGTAQAVQPKASSEIGFVPQFSVAHENLTVAESLNYAHELSSSEVTTKNERVDNTLQLVGLEQHRAKRVSSLSGGQKRRLGLGLEMVSEPECLICDEVTSGLDPLSEDQILELLRQLVENQKKTFICTIHNLGKLPDFDHITVLYEGHLVFQGSFPALQRWFDLKDPLKLYSVLAAQDVGHWVGRWEEQKEDTTSVLTPIKKERSQESTVLPSVADQLLTLLHRRFLLFKRDSVYLWLLVTMTFGFPCVVVIFAIKGLPQIETLSLEQAPMLTEQLQNDLRYRIDAAETATLVTGLIMFQTVLLTLMGSNNGAREIAAERNIYEKERLKGLSPVAYSASKLIFTGTLACLQGLWMAAFVKYICQFPGSYLPQLTMMALCCIAMTFLCLGISAVLAGSEKASILSIYIVGFQLPLSGVVLALPDAVVWLFRPFINAYWSWAGYFSSMKHYQVYDAYRMGDVTWLPEVGTAGLVLFLHCLFGVFMVLYGCHVRRPF